MMKQKIYTTDLQLGMHLVELDRPWLETPFLFQDFILESRDELEEVKRYCEFVYIDRPEMEPSSRDPIQRPTGAGSKKVLHRFSRPSRPPARRDHETLHNTVFEERVSVEQEIPVANGVRKEVNLLIDKAYEDARMGRTTDSGYSKFVVEDLVSSVLRNADAQTLLTQLKSKDRYGATHSMNVGTLALSFGRHLGLAREDLVELGLGAMMLDVGNVRVPSEILNKRGKLTPEEFEAVKKHTLYGMDILQSSHDPLPSASIEVAFMHHERLDGRGYPLGLTGEEIPLYARTVAIVDVYDLMTSDRVYRNGQSPSEALRDLFDSRSGQFDERLVEQFIQCLGVYPIGSVVKCTTDEVGIVIAQNPRRRLRPKVLLVRDPDGKRYDIPKIADLSLFAESNAIDVAEIVKPGDFDIDVEAYVKDLIGATESTDAFQ